MKNSIQIPKWKDKNKYEKILTIMGLFISFLILLLAFLEIFEIYKSINIFELLLGLFILVLSLQYWKYDKKKAIFYLILSICILTCCVIIYFM